MPSTINADNGVVSGSSGVKTTADTSGVLALQSNGSTALSISTGLVTTLTNPLPVGSGGTGITTTPTAGAVPYGNGTTLAYTSAGASGQVLTSAGAGAPTWATISAGNFGTDLTGTEYTLSLPTELSSTAVNSRMQTVALTATTEMMLLYSTSSLQAVVFDNSAGTFGTVVLVRSGNFASYNFVGCIGISTTQVLVSSLPSASAELETVVLSVSGSTITVNTAVATTLAVIANLVNSNNRFVKVGSSYVLHYYISGNFPAFRAITVSGTTPTVGSETVLAAGTYVNSTSYAYSSSILLFIYYTSGGTGITARPYTISGTTITAGTGSSVAADSNVMVTGLLSTGNIAMLHLYNEGQCSVISVAGTVANISTAGTTLTYATWSPQMQIYGNQAFVITGAALGNTDNKLNVITDTSGTATIGTSIDGPGTMVGYLSTGKLFTSSNTSGNSTYYQYGISSGSPVLEKQFSNVSNVNSATTLSLNGAYGVPYAGPPNSANGASGLSIRTSAGKTVSLQAAAVPFAISIDGTSNGKYQQGVAFNGSQITDALSGDTGWSVLILQAPSTTTLKLIKVKVS
jgi:hypothetical protein